MRVTIMNSMLLQEALEKRLSGVQHAAVREALDGRLHLSERRGRGVGETSAVAEEAGSV